VIVLPERVLTDWWRADWHRLVLADLQDLIDELPERLVFGTGAYGQMRPTRRRSTGCGSGASRSSAATDEAVRRYGQLDARHTAAALHLTC
jgi:hypothetical protein